MNIETVIDNLSKRRFQVHHFANRADATAFLKDEIRDQTVGFGGSSTLDELGLYDILGEQNKVFWHWKSTDPSTLENANRSDVYLCSANAIAGTGEIVNIDGRGNRLASLAFGPGKRVIIVAGRNKLCTDLDAAIHRARNVAAPRNAQRFPVNTPCKIDGVCHDCSSPDRICNGMLILWGPMTGMKTDIILIDEDLGY